MATPLDTEIRSRLTAVLAREVALREFYDWFVLATWDVGRSGNIGAIRLTNELDLLFAELSAGVLTGAEVRQALVDAASTYIVTATPWNRATGPLVRTRNANDLIEDRSAAFVLERRRAGALA